MGRHRYKHERKEGEPTTLVLSVGKVMPPLPPWVVRGEIEQTETPDQGDLLDELEAEGKLGEWLYDPELP